MSIDLEGLVQSVLQSNDWKTDKCLPDIIFAEVWSPSYGLTTPEAKSLKE